MMAAQKCYLKFNMKLLIIQPRISYFSGGGELMPMDMIETLLNDSSIEDITLLTTEPISNYSEKYTHSPIHHLPKLIKTLSFIFYV